MTVHSEKKPPLQPVPAGGKNTRAFQLNTEKMENDVLLETRERIKRHPYCSKYSWDDYLTVLDELSNSERYQVLPGRDFIHTHTPDKILVYMRHDIDHDPETALRMANAENKIGMKTSYYILPTAAYYGEQGASTVKRYACMDDLYLKIQGLGHEVGVHNDLLSMMIQWDANPLVFQKQELDYSKSIGLNITGVVSHGSEIVLTRKLNNTWFFSEFEKCGSFVEGGKRYEYGKYSVEDLGFDYEGYRIAPKRGGSDISDHNTIQEAFIAPLKALQPGDRVTVLTHPVRWGKKTDRSPA